MVSIKQAMAVEEKVIKQCQYWLSQQGVDLSAYNTVANAADIADLRTALGYQQVDLYGISYGTRLALTVMRTHPEGIRSVVLDSVYPPGINLFTDRLTSGQRAMQVLFDQCAKEPNCNERYPHLQRIFNQLVTRLNARPIQIKVPVQSYAAAPGMLSRPGQPIDTLNLRQAPKVKSVKVWLNGTELYSLVYSALYSTYLIPVLPETLFAAHVGDWSLLSILAGQVGGGSGVGTNGMFLSVECSEDAPFVTNQQVDAAIQTLPRAIRADERAVDSGMLQECKLWNVRSVDESQVQPVTSPIPTLILEGEFDPITSPSYGEMAAKTLSHSFSFEFPGTGHGVRWTNGCADDIVWNFLDNSTQKPDGSCIATVLEPWA